jgi:FkbM family methyltransferase
VEVEPTSSSGEPRRVALDHYLSKPSQALAEFSRIFKADAPITIFDIGCCEGEESIRFLRHFKQARVFAVEALPNNQQICRENFAVYQSHGIELVPLALGDRVGTTDLFVSSGRPPEAQAEWNHGNKSSSILPPNGEILMHGWLEFKQKISVACSTLDHFCEERGIVEIDVVHMDVQGAESLVLAGAARILPKIGAIWLEVAVKEFYQGQRLKSDLEAVLWQAGFWLFRDYMRGDGEGDQLWLNRRKPRSWRRRVVSRLGRAKYYLLSKLGVKQ